MQILRLLTWSLVITSAFSGIVLAEQPARTLFDFSEPNSASQWQIVNDGVMGGRSTSSAVISADSQMRFSGNLSLANNGGFASVRSRSRTLGLVPGNVLIVKVRGDGRRYSFNLYTPSRRTAFSYRSEFATTAGVWTEIRLPLDRFFATSYGRPVRATLDPRQISSVGILLGDKNPGRFEILIDSIKVQ